MATATKTRSKRKKGKSTEAIYQEVTDRIAQALENGVVPWQRPWRVVGGVHQNFASKRAYRGVNQFLLDLTAMDKGYSSPYWMTYNQAEEKGGQVRKGEKSTLVVFWKILKLPKVENGEEVKDDKGRKIMNKVPLLKYYRVFNAEQIEGIDFPQIEVDEEFTPIQRAEKIIKEMQNAPAITHRGDSAFYRPSTDSITLPPKKRFDTREQYYTTAYHEMAHSTGHESRTGRIKDNWASFGSEPYGKEELVAEMTASMLAGVAGIEIPIDNSAAYIHSWLQTIKGDPKLVVQAASKAQQAADYIQGVKFDA